MKSKKEIEERIKEHEHSIKVLKAQGNRVSKMTIIAFNHTIRTLKWVLS